MRIKSLFLATLLTFAAGAPIASAAPCTNFTDVFDTDSFCPAVEWLKNRAVTSGCTATEYCPQNNVTRAQMALFMNRLGRALTPVILHHEMYLTTNVVIGSPSGGVLLCQTDEDYAVTGFPRVARFGANTYGVPLSSAAWLIGWWRYSIDAGTTWTNVPNATSQRDWAAYGQVVSFAVMAPPMDLEVGTSYRFALFGSGMGGPYTFNPFGCQIEVVITNRNPAVSPFDD